MQIWNWNGGLPVQVEGDDNVNHPSHYTNGSVECIDAIQSALTPEEFEGYCKANAMKYLWRAGRKKDKAEDLRKANWYISKLISVI
jgi:hypothetical protein